MEGTLGPDVTTTLADGIGTITLARPPVNALRSQTWRELGTALDLLVGDRACSVVVLRSGVAGIFCAGADVKELPMPPADDEARQVLARGVLERYLRSPVPIVTAVDGPVLGGGCALVGATDVTVATPRTTFGLPEIRVGRCGGARYLMRHLPQAVVRRAYFTGTVISAVDAHRLGMVVELVDDAGLDGAARSIAAEIASQSPTAVRTAKQALDLVEELPVVVGYQVEQQFSLRLAGHPDAAEAAEAFREKRSPRWSR